MAQVVMTLTLLLQFQLWAGDPCPLSHKIPCQAAEMGPGHPEWVPGSMLELWTKEHSFLMRSCLVDRLSQQLLDSSSHHELKGCLRTKLRQKMQAQEMGRDRFWMSSCEHLALALPDVIYLRLGTVWANKSPPIIKTLWVTFLSLPTKKILTNTGAWVLNFFVNIWIWLDTPKQVTCYLNICSSYFKKNSLNFIVNFYF